MTARYIFSLLLVFYSAIILAGELPDAEKNAHPSDGVKIFGRVPPNVDVVVKGVWRTSSKAIGCTHTIFLAGTFQKRGEAPIQLESSSENLKTWTAWRDYFISGRCGWRLDEIYVYADHRDSGMPTERSSNLPNRIAYVCRDGDKCIDVNTWAENADNSKPVNLYCEFWRLRNLSDRNGGLNPCVMPERFRGTDSGKFEHLLRPSQKEILFRIVDLDNLQ